MRWAMECLARRWWRRLGQELRLGFILVSPQKHMEVFLVEGGEDDEGGTIWQEG